MTRNCASFWPSFWERRREISFRKVVVVGVAAIVCVMILRVSYMARGMMGGRVSGCEGWSIVAFSRGSSTVFTF